MYYSYMDFMDFFFCLPKVMMQFVLPQSRICDTAASSLCNIYEIFKFNLHFFTAVMLQLIYVNKDPINIYQI